MLTRRLFSLKLRGKNSGQNHIKTMKETLEELCVIGDIIEEEDRDIYLLASLSDSFNLLVNVPRREIVTECLFYKETKNKKKGS